MATAWLDPEVMNKGLERIVNNVDETTDQEITNGNPINVPQFRVKMNQPTLV